MANHCAGVVKHQLIIEVTGPIYSINKSATWILAINCQAFVGCCTGYFEFEVFQTINIISACMPTIVNCCLNGSF
jgi:hypothetical protein